YGDRRSQGAAARRVAIPFSGTAAGRAPPRSSPPPPASSTLPRLLAPGPGSPYRARRRGSPLPLGGSAPAPTSAAGSPVSCAWTASRSPSRLLVFGRTIRPPSVAPHRPPLGSLVTAFTSGIGVQIRPE